jgi:hypothetical protein
MQVLYVLYTYTCNDKRCGLQIPTTKLEITYFTTTTQSVNSTKKNGWQSRVGTFISSTYLLKLRTLNNVNPNPHNRQQVNIHILSSFLLTDTDPYAMPESEQKLASYECIRHSVIDPIICKK